MKTLLSCRPGAAVAAVCLLSSIAGAEYVIGPQDVLQISVWQHSELDRLVTVREDGMITFPPIGDVSATGRTTGELAEALEEQLFTFIRGATRVTVTVTQFNSRYVIVTGLVARPGRYAFQTIPNLYEVIGQAGGAIMGAQLSDVRVLRKIRGREEVLKADLGKYVASGDATQLPELHSGDVIVVPGPSGSGEVGLTVPGHVSILGSVVRPGIYQVDQVFSLLDVIALAGGLAAEADPGEVRIISQRAGESQIVATFDLEEILRTGAPVRFPIRVGDAIYVPGKRGGLMSGLTRTAYSLLSFSRDLLNFVLIADYFSD